MLVSFFGEEHGWKNIPGGEYVTFLSMEEIKELLGDNVYYKEEGITERRSQKKDEKNGKTMLWHEIYVRAIKK